MKKRNCLNFLVIEVTGVFNLSKVSKDQVEDTLRKLPKKTSFGDNEVAYTEIVDGMYYTADLITSIINLIIETGHWPNSWKNSLIKPLFKSGDKWDPSSY